MSMSYQELESGLEEVLAAAGSLLPNESFEEARRYIEHDEFELALDTAAATIANSGKHVDRDLYAKIVVLGTELKFDESNWEAIRPT